MALFGFGKNKSNHTASVQQSAAPGTSIQYDPGLIKKLTDDHQNLLKMYGQVASTLEKNDLARVSDLLRQFKIALQEHLLLENVRLYVYLTRHLADDDTNSEIINEFRREMAKIGRTVMDFLRMYTDNPVTAGNVAKFREDFNAIGAALVSRIEREEKSLYTLYVASYA